uniref:non-specific serine/threonine protein kinase n=1 Tax=Candidozyma auris TaxID=498019 RepID=A0A0L0NVU6_CANAR
MATAADKYIALEVIGKGSFGTVRKVRLKETDEILVRKEIEYTSMSIQERNHIISELRILRELNHPNVVKYYHHDHLPEEKVIHIYQEYCDGGDLAKVISTFKRNGENVPEGFIWEVMILTLLALHRCHYGIDAKKVDLFRGSDNSPEPQVDSETVIIHRDIKPDNIFMLDSGKTIKLGDFGLAKMLTSQNDFAKTYVGTPYYMSPEVLMDNPYSPVCDIWSLGCVLYELCNLHPPFRASTHLQLQAKIKKGVIPELSSIYSQQLRKIIKDCITVDPDMRPTCHDMLEILAVKMFRKEMDLKVANATLNELQKQLLIKHEELKKKESSLKTLETKIASEKEDLEAKFRSFERLAQSRKNELQEDYAKLQKKCDLQKRQFEEELMMEFESRKKAMDMEAKEMRLNYQREFKHVVEHEVQQRVSEIILRRKTLEPEYQLQRRQSGSSASSFERQQKAKPRGPRELQEECPQQNQYYTLLQNPSNVPSTSPKRSPLKTRNIEWEADMHSKLSPVRTQHTPQNYKKRITDEFEQLTLQKRHVPEFEEQYLRQNFRH